MLLSWEKVSFISEVWKSIWTLKQRFFKVVGLLEYILQENTISVFLSEWVSDVTYSQILGIRALHLPMQSAHTQQWTHTPWTHTQSSGQPFVLRCPGSSWGFSALLQGTSSWYWGWRECSTFTSPHQFLPAWDSNSQPLDYESDSLIIRPRFMSNFWINKNKQNKNTKKKRKNCIVIN